MTAAETAGLQRNEAGLVAGRRERRGQSGFFVLLAVLWMAFYGVWRALPYVRAGSEVVYAAKAEMVRRGEVFPPGVPVASRVAVFGNSKVLTGFIPDLFDALTGLYSVNLGKPDDAHFADDLEALARTGQLPGTVLLTLPWSVDEAPKMPRDGEIMDALFPFRKLPRDLALFSLRAPARGGMRALYRFGAESVARMKQDRGWYFIEGQSHYAGDSLPPDFRLPSDQPGVADDPAFYASGHEFARLTELAERTGLRFVIVPSYHREGELAPGPESAAQVAARLRGNPRFVVAGPNYYLFPNRMFSDPVHLNPEGARVYTERLAELVKGLP